MRSFTLALLASTALGATFPRGGGGGEPQHPSCPALEKGAPIVSALVDDYAQLIGNYSADLGERFLADEGFTDTSDSINALAGIPLGSTTFANKTAFLQNQESQPKIPFVVTSVNAVTSDTIVLRWTQTFGNPALPAAGISILGFECADDGCWKLKTVYTEFNSLIYFEDTGGKCSRGS